MPATTDLTAMLSAFPEPSQSQDRKQPSGILSDADKPAMDKAVTTALAGGDAIVLALVGTLREADPEADSKARHLIHAMVLRVGASADDRRKLAATLASAIADDQPAEVRAFLLQQVQLIGDKQVIPALTRWLTDEQSSAPATAALLSIGDGAADAFRAALGRCTGRTRMNIVQALGDLRDAASASVIAPLLKAPDADTRTTAARALGQIGNQESADALLRACDCQGFERVAMLDACLTLAQRLAASDSRDAAARMLDNVRETCKSPAEAHIRQAAERVLAKTS